jgi:hypothetical protein
MMKFTLWGSFKIYYEIIVWMYWYWMQYEITKLWWHVTMNSKKLCKIGIIHDMNLDDEKVTWKK